MSGAKPLGHDQVCDGTPNSDVARHTEHGLGTGVPVGHYTPLIHRDHRAVGPVEDELGQVGVHPRGLSVLQRPGTSRTVRMMTPAGSWRAGVTFTPAARRAGRSSSPTARAVISPACARKAGDRPAALLGDHQRLGERGTASPRRWSAPLLCRSSLPKMLVM